MCVALIMTSLATAAGNPGRELLEDDGVSLLARVVAASLSSEAGAESLEVLASFSCAA